MWWIDPRGDSAMAISARVVVFPEEPVSATTGTASVDRTWAPNICRAFVVSSTTTTPPLQLAGASRETMHPPAPAAALWSRKS